MDYNQILQLPPRCLVEQKITKVFFTKNFDLTAAEKKLLQGAVKEMNWLGSIKPATANVPMTANDTERYEEVQVFVCRLPSNELNRYAEKAADMIQKYVPYPILLILEDAENFLFSAAEKRINQADNKKLTIVRQHATGSLSKLYKNAQTEAFFRSLSWSAVDKTDLSVLFNSYIRAVVQQQTAQVTGSYRSRSAERTAQDLAFLQQKDEIEKEIVSLAARLKKENQFNRRVALNEAISELKQRLKTTENALKQ